MNKAEFKAISIIADKLNWHNKPVMEVCEIIKQMVRNQQALELDTVGECDDPEETLLSIALWDHDKIVSTQYVSDYESLVMWGVECFCEDMGITSKDFSAMLTWNSIKDNFLVPEYEMEDRAIQEENDYYLECMEEAVWITKHC